MTTPGKASEDHIFSLYNELQLWKNDVCRECRATQSAGLTLSRPCSIWRVGPDFHEEPRRILFVGKTARGEPGSENAHGVIDARDVGRDLFLTSSWPYWRYTREICEKIFGTADAAWDRIAFTNLIKCNNSATKDATTPTMAQNCLSVLAVFSKELQILKPTHVICYTGRAYDDYLVSQSSQAGWRERTSREAIRRIGSKQMPWWHRELTNNGKAVQHWLRIGHPERMKRDEFVEAVANWIVRARTR